jgi:hypothetical protein
MRRARLARVILYKQSAIAIVAATVWYRVLSLQERSTVEFSVLLDIGSSPLYVYSIVNNSVIRVCNIKYQGIRIEVCHQ